MPHRRRSAPTVFAQPKPSADLPPTAIAQASRLPHRVLGLRTGDLDPVRIILAAHVRLRRWRRLGPIETLRADAGCAASGEVRRIIQARDDLLSIAQRQPDSARE